MPGDRFGCGNLEAKDAGKRVWRKRKATLLPSSVWEARVMLASHSEERAGPRVWQC